MKSDVVGPNPHRSLPRLIGVAAALIAGLGGAFPLFAWYAATHGGSPSVVAAAIAGVVCLMGGLAALVTTFVLQGPLAVHGMLVALVVRSGPPLLLLLFALVNRHPLVKAGLVEYMLAYYFLMLAVETPLSLLLIRTPAPRDAA